MTEAYSNSEAAENLLATSCGRARAHGCVCLHSWFYGQSVAYLMSQYVDVVADVAWRRGVLLLFVFTLLRLLHLYLALHVGLFDHFHLREYTLSHNIPLILSDDLHDVARTSSLGLMLYSILSAFSLSWRLSIIARRSLEALFYGKMERVQITAQNQLRLCENSHLCSAFQTSHRE